MTDLKTCRFCGNSNYDYKHPAARSAWIKYGVRHHAHLRCAVAKLGCTEFLKRLTTWQLESLPIFEIRDLGIEREFLAEIESRRAAASAGAK